MTRTTLRQLALDLVLWLVLPAIFLALYVGYFHVPATAIVPHLRTIGGLLAAFVLLRLMAVTVLPRQARLLFTSVLASLVVYALAVYYLLVLVGLQSWSRVISWDLISSYAPQFGEVMHTLQFPVGFAVVGLALPFLALLYASWRYFRWNDAIAALAAGITGRALAGLMLICAALMSWEYHYFTGGFAKNRFEPLGLTFYPDDGVTVVQGNKLDKLRTAALDKVHDSARQEYQPNPAAQKRNVVLIVVDALRAGNMGVSGYGRPTTPFLSKALANGEAQNQRILRASCAESGCGLLSLSSSLYVHQFPSRPFTLQEALQRHGYKVHMILGGDHMNFYGLRKIYGQVDSFYDGSMAKGYFQNDDSLVLDRVAGLPRWTGEPTMFQFHLMSAHRLGKRMAQAPTWEPSRPYRDYRNRPIAGAGTVLPESVNYYDNGVLQADMVIADLLKRLKGKGYLDDALVVITADHGEALGEHGLHGHSNSVHEELLRIPFVMLSYGAPPAALAQDEINAGQVDIAPTILAQLQMPRPRTWIGIPLQERVTARFSHFTQGGEEGLIDAQSPTQLWKYWINQNTKAEFAFELRTDPRELHNRIGDVPAALKSEWRRQLLTGGATRAGSINRATQ